MHDLTAMPQKNNTSSSAHWSGLLHGTEDIESYVQVILRLCTEKISTVKVLELSV